MHLAHTTNTSRSWATPLFIGRLGVTTQLPMPNLREPGDGGGHARKPSRAEGINTLITDIRRNGNEGIGKPESLKHGLQGYWSRRITDEHRLVYKIVEDEVHIAACRYHYER